MLSEERISLAIQLSAVQLTPMGGWMGANSEKR